jgi:iron complex transport system ATP-binding protein
MSILLSINKLSLEFPGRLLCRDISFDICSGDCIMLCGANGSGKSTLLKRIAQETGKVRFIPTGIPKVAGFSTIDFIITSCYMESSWRGKVSEDMMEKIESTINLLGLSELRDKDISTLSDGEFQKACIATALVKDAEVILLDEPTAYLDIENKFLVMRILRKVAQDTGRAFMISTHDISPALSACNRLFTINSDKSFEQEEISGSQVIKSKFLSKFVSLQTTPV